MTPLQAVLTFTAAAGLLTITPGIDTALVLRTAAVEGPKRAIMAAWGIGLGLVTWGLAAALGIGALLAVSRVAYNALRIIGACYLIYLGVRMVLRRATDAAPIANAEPTPGRSHSAWFVRGYLTNLLNPKVGVFYVTFLPQFIPHGVSVVSFSMLLATIHACEGIVWLASIAWAARSFSGWFRQPRVTQSIDRVTGTILAGFGVDLLFERR
jgi:threonine/homoserine/homoserine lactone efflux protein